MRVLVVGTGGREHALAWKLSQEAEVFATPGNPGIAKVATLVSDDQIPSLDLDLAIVGPENPLIEGLADRLRGMGITTFGPGAAGAHLEGSKAFCKEIMVAAGVPTAGSETCTTPAQAERAVRRFFETGRKAVVKASGAAMGKGVVVCSNLKEGLEAVEMMMVDREFGAAGDTVVIEERLDGREFSLLTVCSGTSYVSLPIAQDHKRALDGDRGPNTGGMGAYSPVPWASADLVKETEERVVEPALRELAARGIDYRGVLFSGLMLDGGTPYCLEYNVRFGDPEAQTVFRRLGAGFLDLLLAAAKGEDLTGRAPEILDQAAVTVVMASQGYPGSYEKHRPLGVPEDTPETVHFHAGTAMQDGQLVTYGGRVLAVSSVGKDLTEARARAYAACEQVSFPDGFYRRDIASSI